MGGSGRGGGSESVFGPHITHCLLEVTKSAERAPLDSNSGLLCDALDHFTVNLSTAGNLLLSGRALIVNF